MDLDGPLWEGVLPGLLRQLYVGRRTGTLTLTHGHERRRVRFYVGNVANAEANVREDRLGDVLLRKGIVDEAAMMRATGIVLRDGRRLGAVLVDLGLLDREALREALAAHVDVVLSKAFRWTDGHYAFQDETGLIQDADELSLPFSTGDLILRASRSVSDPDVVRYHLGEMTRRLSLSRDPLLRFQRLDLTQGERCVLSRVDGLQTAKEIVDRVPLTREDGRLSLFALLNVGIVDYVEEARRERHDVPALSPLPSPFLPEEEATDARIDPGDSAGDEAAASTPLPTPPSDDTAAAEEAAPRPAADAAASGERARDEGVDQGASDARAVPDPASEISVEEIVAAERAADTLEAAPEPTSAVLPTPPEVPDLGTHDGEPLGRPEPEPPSLPGPAPGSGEPALVLSREEDAHEPVEWLPLPDIDLPPGIEDSPTAPEPAAPDSVDAQREGILETHAALGQRNHYDLLGLAPDASDGQVREAYFRMAKRFHPDAHHVLGLSDLREALESIFVRLGEAYEVLRSPRLRARYDRDQGISKVPGTGDDVGKVIARAAEAFKHERFWEALPLLEWAVPRAQAAAKQRGRILLAQIYARDPDWVKPAEELLLAAVQQQADNSEAHYYLGLIYSHLGLRSRALAAFRRVVDLEPESADAWRRLAELDRQAAVPAHIRRQLRAR